MIRGAEYVEKHPSRIFPTLFVFGRNFGSKFLYYMYPFGVNLLCLWPQLSPWPALQPASGTSVSAWPIQPPFQLTPDDKLT